MFVYLVPKEAKRGCQIPGAWSYIMDRCELPCGYWESNSGLLEKLSVLLIPEASLALRPLILVVVLSFGFPIIRWNMVTHCISGNVAIITW